MELEAGEFDVQAYKGRRPYSVNSITIYSTAFAQHHLFSRLLSQSLQLTPAGQPKK